MYSMRITEYTSELLPRESTNQAGFDSPYMTIYCALFRKNFPHTAKLLGIISEQDLR